MAGVRWPFESVSHANRSATDYRVRSRCCRFSGLDARDESEAEDILLGGHLDPFLDGSVLDPFLDAVEFLPRMCT